MEKSYFSAVLSSRAHWCWLWRAGSRR